MANSSKQQNDIELLVKLSKKSNKKQFLEKIATYFGERNPTTLSTVDLTYLHKLTNVIRVEKFKLIFQFVKHHHKLPTNEFKLLELENQIHEQFSCLIYGNEQYDRAMEMIARLSTKLVNIKHKSTNIDENIKKYMFEQIMNNISSVPTVVSLNKKQCM